MQRLPFPAGLCFCSLCAVQVWYLKRSYTPPSPSYTGRAKKPAPVDLPPPLRDKLRAIQDRVARKTAREFHEVKGV
jgi:hypothetical protein